MCGDTLIRFRIANGTRPALQSCGCIITGRLCVAGDTFADVQTGSWSEGEELELRGPQALGSPQRIMADCYRGTNRGNLGTLVFKAYLFFLPAAAGHFCKLTPITLKHGYYELNHHEFSVPQICLDQHDNPSTVEKLL